MLRWRSVEWRKRNGSDAVFDSEMARKFHVGHVSAIFHARIIDKLKEAALNGQRTKGSGFQLNSESISFGLIEGAQFPMVLGVVFHHFGKRKLGRSEAGKCDILMNFSKFDGE